jgi:hypothetical protein
MRSAIGGWVEKSLDMPRPLKGLAIINAPVVSRAGSGGSLVFP